MRLSRPLRLALALSFAALAAPAPMVAVDGVNALPDDPYTARYEDLRVKPR